MLAANPNYHRFCSPTIPTNHCQHLPRCIIKCGCRCGLILYLPRAGRMADPLILGQAPLNTSAESNQYQSTRFPLTSSLEAIYVHHFDDANVTTVNKNIPVYQKGLLCGEDREIALHMRPAFHTIDGQTVITPKTPILVNYLCKPSPLLLRCVLLRHRLGAHKLRMISNTTALLGRLAR